MEFIGRDQSGFGKGTQMAKGYVFSKDVVKDPDGFSTRIDVEFSSKKEAAYSWQTEQEARDEANILERRDIAITTAEGQRHVCKGYRVEERAPGEFIIWCEAPFRQTVVEK
jgi:hypothetical protein